MKKIFSFSSLIVLLAIIFLPLFLMLHAHHMNHGGVVECVSHCLSSVDSFSEESSISLNSVITITISVIYAKIYEFTLALSLLYIFVVFPPPNIFRYIKNYSYSQLRGIIISTT